MKPTHRVKFFLPSVLIYTCVLPGCSLLGHFGYYKYQKSETSPAEASSPVDFPSSYEGGIRLEGDMMKALSVAMNDYLPSHIRPEDQTGPEYQCLARWDTYRTSVKKANDDLFFVLLSPDLSRCAPGFMVPDAGAEYAIDGQGRILTRR